MPIMASFRFLCIYLHIENIPKASTSNHCRQLCLESGILLAEPRGEDTFVSFEVFHICLL